MIVNRDSKQTTAAPPPPAPTKVPADFQKKLDDLKAQLEAAEKRHASQMKEAEGKLSNLQGNSSKEMEDLRKQFAKDMEALKKAMEQVWCLSNSFSRLETGCIIWNYFYFHFFKFRFRCIDNVLMYMKRILILQELHWCNYVYYKEIRVLNEKRILLQIINQILVLICDLLCLTGSWVWTPTFYWRFTTTVCRVTSWQYCIINGEQWSKRQS